MIYIILNIIYTTRRRDRLWEEYEDESRDLRQLGVFRVVTYELLSLAFLIWMFSTVGTH